MYNSLIVSEENLFWRLLMNRWTSLKTGILFFLIAAVFVANPRASSALDNGLALTPPMGWNSWNKFGCNVSESLIKSMADSMVKNGMKAAGYRYIVIDDCWQVSRNAKGNIVADPKRFPSGMKALARYIHSKGLKFGLYSDAGTKTCAGRPGSLGHELQDARQYAAWGVDYLKYDWCNTGKENPKTLYTAMSDALRASKRPIVFSMCEWGSSKPWLWAKDVGNLWRTTGDIGDCFDCKMQWQNGWTKLLDQQVGLESYAGPGHWNDPDMLEVGNGGMTTEEYRSHFSLWCLLAAPLLAGNDLHHMTPEIKSILTNKEVIAVDQDKLGVQGHRARKDGDREVWVKPLKDGSRAAVLFNRGKTAVEISLSWKDLGFSANAPASIRDLWAKKGLGSFAGGFKAKVPSHGVVMVKVTADQPKDK
jgi:alpha-galactosidase